MQRSIWLGTLLALVHAAGGCAASTAPNRTITAKIDQSGAILQCLTVQLTVTVQDASGVAVSPDSVKWVGSDPATLSVSVSGLAKALQVSGVAVIVTATAFRDGSQATAQKALYVSADSGPRTCP